MNWSCVFTKSEWAFLLHSKSFFFSAEEILRDTKIQRASKSNPKPKEKHWQNTNKENPKASLQAFQESFSFSEQWHLYLYICGFSVAESIRKSGLRGGWERGVGEESIGAEPRNYCVLCVCVFFSLRFLCGWDRRFLSQHNPLSTSKGSDWSKRKPHMDLPHKNL